ncbi:hypothetical protein [Candidatus Lokiarchaeum ossiferum]|uniref:hypothetical protein n=1 Tax=Candidatus Lokiarchaeum ossiferum TaxID=2951803 RepID=UPI00352DE352
MGEFVRFRSKMKRIFKITGDLALIHHFRTFSDDPDLILEDLLADPTPSAFHRLSADQMLLLQAHMTSDQYHFCKRILLKDHPLLVFMHRRDFIGLEDDFRLLK